MNILVFGAGTFGEVYCKKALMAGDNILAIADNNSDLIGKRKSIFTPPKRTIVLIKW